MIEIIRKASVVKLKLEVAIPGTNGYVYTFDWSCNSEDYAQLLVNQFRKELMEKLKDARRSSYEAGYKDAKAKKRKQDWFSGTL